MISSSTSRESPFAKYVRLLVNLHTLETLGRAESVEADHVRDAMDAPWRRLTRDQIALVRGLSSDLYAVESPPNDINTVRKDIEDSIRSAAAREQYQKVLTTLRENSRILPTAFVAHWQGICWADLQQIEVAIVFFSKAREIDPQNGFHDYMLLRAFLWSENFGDALGLAREISARETNAPILWVAGMILFRCATPTSAPRNDQLLQLAIDCIEKANRSSNEAFLVQFKIDAAAANTWRSLAYDQLEQADKALDACEYALKLDPTNKTARKIRAMLTRTTDIQSSRSDAIEGFAAHSPVDEDLTFEPRFSDFENFQLALAS